EPDESFRSLRGTLTFFADPDFAGRHHAVSYDSRLRPRGGRPREAGHGARRGSADRRAALAGGRHRRDPALRLAGAGMVAHALRARAGARRGRDEGGGVGRRGDGRGAVARAPGGADARRHRLPGLRAFVENFHQTEPDGVVRDEPIAPYVEGIGAVEPPAASRLTRDVAF